MQFIDNLEKTTAEHIGFFRTIVDARVLGILTEEEYEKERLMIINSVRRSVGFEPLTLPEIREGKEPNESLP